MIGPILIISKNNKSIHLGLIGAGKWGSNYINLIQKLNGVKLSALATRNKNKIIPGDYQIYDSWENICKNNDLDGIIIATPPDTHIKIATYAIKNNLPVLIEKPLSLNLDETNQFYKYIKSINAKAMVNFIHLFNPFYIELKNQIGNMGNIKSIESRGGDWGPFRRNTPPLWDWGCHDIAMCLDLLKKTPSTICKEVIKLKQEDLNHRTQEPQNIKIQLKFENNVNAKIIVGNLMKNKCRIIRVNYENTFIEFDDIKKILIKSNKYETINIKNIPNLKMSPLECTIREFMNYILDVKNNNNIDLAVKVTKILNTCDKTTNG